MKLFLIFIYIIAFTIIFLVLLQFIFELNEDNDWNERQQAMPISPDDLLATEVKHPIIVWWTDFVKFSIAKRCGDVSCFFTNKRLFRHHRLAKALMFYGSNINITDMPLPREGKKIIWALLHEESPRNIPALSHQEALSLFNYTSTFSRHSDFPLTTQYLKDLEVLTEETFFVPVEKKHRLQQELGLAPVVYIQSDCSTSLDRDSYVAELSKYINVDSYGACLHNRSLPESLRDNLATMMSDELLHFVARYQFAIAIENGECEDYITEKLWRPLITGSVPIYMGSPSVKDWLPNSNSAILALDFSSPKHLAEYLHDLIKNNDKYNFHLQHKLLPEKENRITNQRLINTMNNRKWGIDNDITKGNFIEHFECFVCRKIHESKEASHFANNEHYKCPIPQSILSRRQNLSNSWLDQWKIGRCEAKVLRHFVEINRVNYSFYDFYNKLSKYLDIGLC